MSQPDRSAQPVRTARTRRSFPHPKESLERCALRAQLRGDPMLGTAFPAARLLLVEQPGPWGPRGLRQSRFDAATAVTLEARAASLGVRVQAVRQPGRTPLEHRRRWALVDTRDSAETVHWGTFDADTELLELPLDGSVGTRDDEPLYLVCAHSKHDTCCALRGRPVAAAIGQLRPGRVWEASHLGGDRFAANVLVLPVGLMYGRLLPFAAAEFVAAAEAGEVIGALLRGRIGLPPVAQAAIGWAHDQLALRRRQDLRLESVVPATRGETVVRVHTPHGRVDVTVHAERVNTADGLTCAIPQPSSYVRYRCTALTPVEPIEDV